jgi:hypothetical protein
MEMIFCSSVGLFASFFSGGFLNLDRFPIIVPSCDMSLPWQATTSKIHAVTQSTC